MQKRIAAVAVAFAVSLAAPVAHAQDAAGAEVLFRQGHQLFEAKKYAEACPKFAESYRLDPVSGALLALASCHEAEGKLASAWAEYVDVVARARREGKNDRADAAQQRANTLEPKLAHITIALGQGADVAGLQVKRDGIVIGPATFGTALPVDHGEHTVEASAPGHQAFTKKLTVQDGANETVAIPVLPATTTEAPPVVPPPQPPPQPQQQSQQQPQPAPDQGARPFPARTLGIVAGAVGVVTMGVGGYFGLQAISKNDDSNTMGCTGDVCTGAGKTARMDAVSAGNTSTILFVVGGVLTAAGVVLFIVGGSSSGEAKPAVAAAPAVGPGTGGVALSGRF